MQTPINLKAEARRLFDLGFGIHWLKPREKVPVKSGWSGDNRDTLLTLMKEYKPTYNIGTKLGKPSFITTPFGDEGYLAVIDVDVKGSEPKHQNAAKAKINEMFPGLLETAPITLSGRGNGSMHIWCLVDEPVESCALYASNEQVEVYMPSAKATDKQIEVLGKKKVKEGWRLRPAFEVDFMCAGRQVVLPPSIHPDTGKKYKWKNPINDSVDLPFLDIKEFLKTFQVTKKTHAGRPAGGSVAMTTPIDVSEFDLEMKLKPEVVDNIVEGSNVDDRSAALLSVAMSMIHAGFSDGEIIGVLTCRKYFLGDVAYEHAKSSNRMKAARWVERYTVQIAHQEISSTKDFDGEVEVYETLPEEEAQKQKKKIVNKDEVDKTVMGKESWKLKLDKTNKGDNKPTYANTKLILENAISNKLFKFDEFSKQIYYGEDSPWGAKKDKIVDNLDETLVLDWLSKRDWKIEPSDGQIIKAIKVIAAMNTFNPVKEYLTSVEWDGVPRIKTWLKDYLDADGDDIYLERIGEIFLVACVARIFEPGIKFDIMPIFEGKQGVGKSTVGRILAGEKWFYDSPLDLHDKDSQLNLQGQWLVEMGELANMKKADVTTIKNYITRQFDKFRPPYERSQVTFARQCVFFGTTNETSYLKDLSGNRRFFPIKVGNVDLNSLSRDRDQLWAEAVFLYDMGVTIYLDRDDEKHIIDLANQIQDKRIVSDSGSIIREQIGEWKLDLIKELKKKNIPLSSYKFKMKDLFYPNDFPDENGINIKPPLLEFKFNNSYDAQLAANALRHHGFDSKKNGGYMKWKYISKKEGVQK